LIEYARVIVRVGVNIQKGQTLVLTCPVECAAFGRLVAFEAYEAGAGDVVVRWVDDELSRLKFMRADTSIFDEFAEWSKTFFYEYAEKKAAFVSVLATDPELYRDVDPDRLRRSNMAAGKALKSYMDMQMRNDIPWCVVSIPTMSWAAKVFPDVDTEIAVDKLWDAIMSAVRVTGDGTSVDSWREHITRLNGRSEKLNSYQFAKRIYKNSLGTDLTVELPEKAIWGGVGDNAKTGVSFVANMPSEEIATLPKKDGVNGVICSSMPLSLDGVVIRDIRFTVVNGKIVEATATEGLETLVSKLDMDEGARYFGEVALVPHNSPISDLGILFYNTLFDENASCHFAFGKAYPAFSDADDLTEDDLIARGANDSFVHVDFMVGTPDLSITGITPDGKEIAVFTNGNFAI
jgi:aminopeptidase